MAEEESKDKQNITDYGTHLINLITNQDIAYQNWFKFLITIESGLAMGLGFLLKMGGQEKNAVMQLGLPVVKYLIPVLGIIVAVFLCIIIVRERRWQAWYVQQYRNLPGDIPVVFPGLIGWKTSIEKLRYGFISKAIMWFVGLIILAWLVIIVLFLVPDCATTPSRFSPNTVCLIV